MPISRANGLDIYYETAGAGPPLVLIHALPVRHAQTLPQFPGVIHHPVEQQHIGFGRIRLRRSSTCVRD